MVGRQTYFGKVRTRIVDAATGETVKVSPWKTNLIFDSGLNRLASGVGYANFFSTCKVGSSNAANSIASGAITFTQTGTTITASGGFFTSGMTGAILKFGTGTGGAEQYITFVNSTTATSLTSMTQSTPIVGTVWLVQQTGLTTLVLSTTNLQTSTGSNSSTFTTNSVTHQRIFVFPQQGSPYSVNEIGYDNGNGGATCNGRVVLGATDVISPSQFYAVEVQMTFVITPGVPTAAANVGTGIDTTGTASINFWDCQIVTAAGNQGFAVTNAPSMLCDGSSQIAVAVATGAQLSQNITQTNVPTAIGVIAVIGQTGNLSNSGQAVGVGIQNLTFSLSTAGQTVNAFVIGGNTSPTSIRPIFVLNLTTPFTLPTGTFSGTFSFKVQFTRTLSN
jgi:hypothetical protein